MQTRIREAKQKLLPELKIAEIELNREFKKKKKKKTARGDSYSSLKSAEQKAKADPKKYLAKASPNGATGTTGKHGSCCAQEWS